MAASKGIRVEEISISKPKKNPIASILGDEGDDDEMESSEHEDSDDVTAAGAVREALESGSDKELAAALRGFMKVCDGDDGASMPSPKGLSKLLGG